MSEGLGSTERKMVLLVPLISILLGSLLLFLLFPNYRELSDWVQEGLSSVPYLVWGALGAVLGAVIARIQKKKPELYKTYSKRIKAGFLSWLLISVIISSLTEDGDLFQRMSNGPLFKAWLVLLFIIISGSPTYFGVLAVLTRKRIYIAGSVMMTFLISASCMIFSQADSATVISQDPILSVLLIWCLITFVEGVNWLKRYIDRDPAVFPSSPSGKDVLGVLWKRQVSYTVIFLGISSLIAVLPFVVPATFDVSSFWPYTFYESSTVIGKVLISLIILVPLFILSFGRRYLDGIKGKGDRDDDGSI